MLVTVDPLDDLMHEPDPDPTYNESAYTSFADPERRFGGFLRLGNRVHEGFAEVTVCVYLPDGRIAFWFVRQPITSNKSHDAGGLRFDVAEPLTEYLITYDGPVVILTDPTQLEEPKNAFTQNPQVPCRLDLRSRPTGPMIRPWDESDFAKVHLEQHMIMQGTVVVGDEHFDLHDGYGIRDRSWGPRDWHHFRWHRWLTMSFGPDLGLALFTTEDSDGAEQIRGYVHHGMDAAPQEILDAHIDTDYDPATGYARSARVRVGTGDGAELQIEGQAWSTIPLRHRKANLTARLTEGMASWRIGERRGVGLFEYFDKIVDGQRVGP